MNKVIALIPARSGSKGVPNKNIRLLLGQPLISWSIIAAKKCKLIDRVIVSTDSSEYAQLSKNYGAEVPFLRPEKISGDSSVDYDFIIHALDWLKNSEGQEFDYVVHLRPTTPLRETFLIDEAIELFRKSNKATSLRSAHKMPESAYKTLEISSKGCFKTIGSNSCSLDSANIARQQFPSTYQPNGYVDVLSTKFIRENKALHGDWVLPFLTPLTLEVDTEDDFNFIEYLATQNPEFYKELFS